MRPARILISGLLLLPAGACTSTPAPKDPAAELARHHDEWWTYLAKSYDRDGDGRVTRAEYGRDDAAFRRLDRDGDGAITRADFERALVLPPDLVVPMLLVRLAGGPDDDSAPIAQVLAAFARLDVNGDGRVDRAEYLAGSGEGTTGVDRFATLLAGVDADGDGLVAPVELARWLEARDTDHDGRIARREREVPGPAPAEGFVEAARREAAPRFTATALPEGKAVALDSLIGPVPVALIFGSFT